jgi:hypothetical protein
MHFLCLATFISPLFRNGDTHLLLSVFDLEKLDMSTPHLRLQQNMQKQGGNRDQNVVQDSKIKQTEDYEKTVTLQA